MSVAAEPENARKSAESSGAPATEPLPIADVAPPEHSRKNFLLLVLYQVVVRTGWIFKTESIVMPAVLDLTGAGAWMRAILPALNRFGQTIPPLLYSGRLSRQRFKKFSLALFTAIMGSCFLLLAVTWGMSISETVPLWFGWLFLAAYGAFFIATGLNQISFGTLQGKLIPAHRRGRLLLASNVVGVVLAVLAVGLLLPGWLAGPTGQFQLIFGFTGSCFIASAALILWVDERADGVQSPLPTGPGRLSRTLVHLRTDRQLQKISIVAASLGASFILFPHYQALARERLGLGLEQIVLWVIIQNVGTALFSIPAGWMADRFGNRLVLRFCMGLLLISPILAWWLSRQPGTSTATYASVFFFVGLTPVSLRMISNYTLELTTTDRHPIYLSSLGLSLGIPTIALSPLFGLLIDWAGFDIAFGLVIGLMAIGWLMTFAIVEPRQQKYGEGSRPLDQDHP